MSMYARRMKNVDVNFRRPRVLEEVSAFAATTAGEAISTNLDMEAFEEGVGFAHIEVNLEDNRILPYAIARTFFFLTGPDYPCRSP